MTKLIKEQKTEQEEASYSGVKYPDRSSEEWSECLQEILDGGGQEEPIGNCVTCGGCANHHPETYRCMSGGGYPDSAQSAEDCEDYAAKDGGA